MKRTLLSLAAAGASVLAGCAAQPVDATGPKTECPVCRYNADLACLDVHVTNQTPTAQYQGRTYYFCSQECKAEFEKNPAKYAAN
jgi:YHS domain-containing protein